LIAGKKSTALYHLKSKKNLLKLLETRLGSLETLENIVLKINSSKTEIEILNAYNVGSEALKQILGRKELQIDNVEHTIDALAEVLADHRDIEDAMQISQESYDDNDLENELDLLVNEEKKLDEDALLKSLNELKVSDTPLLAATATASAKDNINNTEREAIENS
jgi:charged multivesicular body protein 7